MSRKLGLNRGATWVVFAWLSGWCSLGAAGPAAQERLPDLPLPPQEPVPLVIPDGGNEFGQPLLRGPVHEAFAELYQADPVPGPIIQQRPPALIDEVPPELQPTGRNIEWIPGYWAFDEQAEEFLWVSGVWREIPPGFRWLPGYWLELENQQGYQWVSGTWFQAESNEVQYLPVAPPATLDRGPVGAAPSANHIWVPGNWHWQERQYAWRPGFWSAGHADWVWIPARYQWTPRGFVFCRGYWDYPLVRRGTLFSPYRFHRPFFAQPLVAFTPRVIIAVDVLPRHLWVRPSHHHYYFGDFYDGFAGHGFVPWHHWAVGARSGVNININFGNPRNFYCGFDPLFHHVSRTTVINNVNVTNIQVNQINQQFNYFNQFNQNFTQLQTFADQRPGRELGKVVRRGDVGGGANPREARLGLSLEDHVQTVGRDRFAEVRDQQRRVRLEELNQTRDLAAARQAIERRTRAAGSVEANPAARGVEIASLPASPRGRQPTEAGRRPRGSADNPRPNNDLADNRRPGPDTAGGRPGRAEGLPSVGGRDRAGRDITSREVNGREITGREITGREGRGREIGGRGGEPGRATGVREGEAAERGWVDPTAAARGRVPVEANGDRSGILRAAEETAIVNAQRRLAVERAQERMGGRNPNSPLVDRPGVVQPGASGRRIAEGTSESELRSWVENYQRRQGVDPNTARRLGEQFVPPGSQRQIDLTAEERARQRGSERSNATGRDARGRDPGGLELYRRDLGGGGTGGREIGGRTNGRPDVGRPDVGGRDLGRPGVGGRGSGTRDGGGRGDTQPRSARGEGSPLGWVPGAAPSRNGGVYRGTADNAATYSPSAGVLNRTQPATGRNLSNQPATGRNLSNQPTTGRNLSNLPATGRNLSNQPATGRNLSNPGQALGQSGEGRPSGGARATGGVNPGRGSSVRGGESPGNRGGYRGGEGGGPSRGGRGRGGE